MTCPPDPDAADGAARLLRGAATAERRMADRSRHRAADLAADEAGRLDDRLRALLDHHLAEMVDAIETRLREGAARLLLTRGRHAEAGGLRGASGVAYARLTAAASLAEPKLVAELTARLRHDLLADRLQPRAAEDGEPSLLVRLVDVADAEVSACARALMIAESRRREALAMGPVADSDLSAELHQRLVWQVAAALHKEAEPSVDQALADAAARLLLDHDEGERAEARAMRLALAIGARPHELPMVIDEALADGRLSLVIAALAVAADLSFEQVRALVVEPDDERWWLLLRAIDLDPLCIARIGLALAQADPRRREDQLPDLIDALAAMSAADARGAIANLWLPGDFRAAVTLLESAGA